MVAATAQPLFGIPYLLSYHDGAAFVLNMVAAMAQPLFGIPYLLLYHDGAAFKALKRDDVGAARPNEGVGCRKVIKLTFLAIA
jgi:hypothetical protein